MNKFYEAVSMTVALPEKDQNFIAIDFASGYCRTLEYPNEYLKKRFSHWFRPLPVPEGLAEVEKSCLDEDIIDQSAQTFLLDHTAIEVNPYGAYVAGWKGAVNDFVQEITPFIASQQAEIERLKAELKNESDSHKTTLQVAQFGFDGRDLQVNNLRQAMKTLCEQVIKHHPKMQMPEQEDFYNAYHKAMFVLNEG